MWSRKPVMMTWLFLIFYVKLGEDVNALVIAKSSHRYKRACGDVVEDVGGLRFGGDGAEWLSF